MAGLNEHLQREIADSKTPSQESSDGCFICQQQLWISVFFDEPGHDAEKEYGTERLSNIGKLLFTHPVLPERGIYRLYYNGLGVKFREPNVARRKTAEDIGSAQAKDVAKDKAKDAGKQVLTGKGKEALQDLKNPKSWLGDIAGILAKIGIESSDAVRDKEVVSQITLSGVATRVDNAIAKFDQVVKDQTERVTHINVAVFGSGLGGAMARLFVNKLLAACTRRADVLYPTPKGDATLEIRFLGLLDGMSATLDDNSIVKMALGKLSFGFATLRIEGPMGIPEEVQRAVHYVAGHELRVTRRLDSIRRGRAQSMQEIVLAGNHEDIAGNYADGFESRSAQLSRVAVMKLHGDAYSAGVPIMSMRRLENRDFKLYNLMQITAVSKVYAVDKQGAPLNDLLLLYYIRTSGDLEKQLLEHMRHFVSWMRRRYDTPNHPGRPPQAAYELAEKHIKRLYDMTHHPQATYRLSEVERTLLETWYRPLDLRDYEMAIFDDYVHDELYRSPFDQFLADSLHNGYFKLRGIDQSDELK